MQVSIDISIVYTWTSSAAENTNIDTYILFLNNS